MSIPYRYIVVPICLGQICAGLIVSSFFTNDEPQYRAYSGYTAELPDMSYNEIVRQFSTMHKPYSEQKEENTESSVEPKQELVQLDMVINDVYSDLSKELNSYLYDVCQRYAGNMYCSGYHLSPLFPLAEANLETNYQDSSKTFSSIAPTGIYDFRSAQELRDFNVTRILDSERTWSRMARDWWTRDRGPLQCYTDFGEDSASYGPSEKELLTAYVKKNGMPIYGSITDSVGTTYDVAEWISSSRNKHGDRYNVESLIKMFVGDKTNKDIPSIERNFANIQNEFHVYAIMAYNHWIGMGFTTMNESTSYSGFQTIGRAYEYCEDISSPTAIEIIYSQCLEDIQAARSRGGYPPSSLDRSKARKVFDKLVAAGVCKDWDYYFRHKMTGSWDQGETACGYALGVIYGVMQMNLLYSGY